MGENITSSEILAAMRLTANDQTQTEFQIAGTTPNSIASTEIKKVITVLGITPEDFDTAYSSIEFNLEDLKAKFVQYCKDYNHPLKEKTPSKALEFAAKILFEYGPYIRAEKKSKGDKAIKFRFPYRKNDNDLTIRVVIVTTFKDMTFKTQEEDNKLILTFRHTGLLAMTTFSKAIEFCYNLNEAKLLTPLCGAIFSRDIVQDMAKDLGVEEVKCLQIINESSDSGGQYLPDSDIACAVVCMITSTKRLSDKHIRDTMISKVVKQYIHQGKKYENTKFTIFAIYALGGVPQGLDSSTLIEMYNTVQAQGVSLRARTIASRETLTTYEATLPAPAKRSPSPTISAKSPKK